MAQLVLISGIIALGLAFIGLLVTMKTNSDMEKNSPFECGFIPKSNSRSMFSLQFFLIALIFLIFDVELILMFPYLGNTSFINSLSSTLVLSGFLFILSAGFIWEWMQGMLEWNK